MATTYPITPGVRFNVVEEDPIYCVGDDGSVWSFASGSWRQLKPSPQYRGHLTIMLRGRKTRFVHRLVLEAFVGPCPEGMECRHLDDNPTNNRLDNLAWGTKVENNADMVKHGRSFFHGERGQDQIRSDYAWSHVEHKSGERHHRAKLSDEQVRIIRATVDPTRRDGAASRLAREWDVSAAAVRMIARGLRRCSG